MKKLLLTQTIILVLGINVCSQQAIAKNVKQVSMAPNQVGILDSNGKVSVLEGPLNSAWQSIMSYGAQQLSLYDLSIALAG